tara:strand:- start:108 stop:854 length:747 start_codon:yes stop_codon:yes gene_type:complete
MVKIIGISGTKQAGKNTVANFINGKVLKQIEMISDFKITLSGQLEIKTLDSSGHQGWGIFDVTRKDKDFIEYADLNLWPHIKIYHFADCLKKMCVDLFDLEPHQVYGSDADKNTKTAYSINGWNHKMTAREFLQYLGTDVMRKIKDTIWVDYTIKTILKEKSEIALIPDVRFPNEVEAIHKAGGIVLRLTRNPYASDHRCETALSREEYDWNNFDYVIDNNNSDINTLMEDLENVKHLWSHQHVNNLR